MIITIYLFIICHCVVQYDVCVGMCMCVISLYALNTILRYELLKY